MIISTQTMHPNYCANTVFIGIDNMRFERMRVQHVGFPIRCFKTVKFNYKIKILTYQDFTLKPVIIIFVVVCTFALSSCGQYGPLYMPTHTTTKSGKSTTSPPSQKS